MFDIVFGWRKASKCKKLIKRVQCRLKLLRSKRLAIIRHLREDIAQLWKSGYQHIAYNRLDQLCIDEDMMLVYELLEQFSEFIILNLSYIRRHKDLSKDVHEAVSTLIFASVRCGDLPELRLVRKLFEERYGRNVTVAAVELHPGNLVNIQVRDKLTIQSVSEDVKNRLLDEILKVSLFKPGLLALEYKPDSQVQSSKSYPSIAEALKEAKVHSFALLSTPYSECEAGAIQVIKSDQTGNAAGSGCSSIEHQYTDQDSVIYLDDIQEFKSPTKQRNSMHCLDQDQRFFVFRSSSLYDKHSDQLARKRIRWGSESTETQIVEDVECENCYSYKSDNRRKYQRKEEFEQMEKFYLLEQGCKKLESRCSLHQPCYFYTNNSNNANYQGKEEIQAIDLPQTPLKLDYMDTLLPSKSRALKSYVRAATMPQSREIMVIKSCTEMSRSNSLPLQMNYSSRKHVHPKLPDYDEIAAKFRALKKAHQLNKSTRPLKVPAPLIPLILLLTFLSFHISLVS
ncbi:uncharacterized protein LOC110684492 [Chenopodium quinoa]|uniref:uncharacterized protein LOC110684492 n=1 Tax=Chenopodium quinoa TaxID=63459 RepID=UPI000B776F05|nr:uncharacterized protein LOC110684492 [Chenopodium quinoa]